MGELVCNSRTFEFYDNSSPEHFFENVQLCAFSYFMKIGKEGLKETLEAMAEGKLNLVEILKPELTKLYKMLGGKLSPEMEEKLFGKLPAAILKLYKTLGGKLSPEMEKRLFGKLPAILKRMAEDEDKAERRLGAADFNGATGSSLNLWFLLAAFLLTATIAATYLAQRRLSVRKRRRSFGFEARCDADYEQIARVL